MEEVVSILKYVFVAGLALEVGLILWSLVRLAREKAVQSPAPATEE